MYGKTDGHKEKGKENELERIKGQKTGRGKETEGDGKKSESEVAQLCPTLRPHGL